ncbi:hypothetical protein [Nocardia alni]|uniref:hypothetical protein n=1 Tax=Nocardia alni TaxID=2815723 RepID=UPI001C223A45|nr:hypothetical protein [Nocardia alni]
MNEDQNQRHAQEALALMTAHQERTRRAARVPGWFYVAMFVFSVAATAANDVVGIGGRKVIGAGVLVLLLATLTVRLFTRSAPLSLVRGVAPRQSSQPRVYIAVLFAAAVLGWLIVRYGTGLAHSLATALGVPGYPNTVAGLLYAAAATGLFALSQQLMARPSSR